MILCSSGLNKNLLHIAFLIIVFTSCSTQKNGATMEPIAEKEDIEKILGTKYDCINNEDEQYKLCFSYLYEQKVKYVSFVVYEVMSKKIIHEESRVRKVKWDSRNLLRVDNFTRMPTNEGTGDYYLFDVQKKEKLTNNN